MDNAQPLDDTHSQVNPGTHVIGSEAAHEGVELGGRRADAQEQGDFDEDYKEGGC